MTETGADESVSNGPARPPPEFPAATEPASGAGPAAPPRDLLRLGKVAAQVARDEIVPLLGRARPERKEDGSLRTPVDEAAQRRLLEELALGWPEIPVLGEESPRYQQEAVLNGDGPYWCLDPLDGTSNFVAGLPFYGVSVALVDHMGPRMGVVHDPVRQETFGAVRGGGAWLDDTPLSPSASGPVPPLHQAMALVDFKRLPPALAARVAVEHPFRSQRNLGSSALEWCWVAAGRCHLYLHGSQSFWDWAAGWLILTEAGGAAYLEEGLGSGDGRDSPRPGLDGLAVTAAASPSLLAEVRRWLGTVSLP
ncbi:MAG: inositol monophosphatase [Gemmatimonadales bacterium]|nr:MAG: inositol monophosphatase [Gemmatimonadales bacterium]